MNSQDKLKIIFPNYKDVFKMFHIDFKTGRIYKKDFWDRNLEKEVGRLTSDENYRRVNIVCPHLIHIFKRGYIDVSAHRLIYYAYTGELPEKVDHIDKNVKYLDAISNLRASDSIHNRWNTPKIKRKNESSFNKNQKVSEQNRGINFLYNYYWARFDGKIINENGFISELLAVDFRNNYLKEHYIKIYGSLNNFPDNALDFVNQEELFLDKMLQEAIEKTKEYQEKQQTIKIERERRSKIEYKKQISKNKIPIKTEDDPFDCIGKYDP
jgi:hypothetical protein